MNLKINNKKETILSRMTKAVLATILAGAALAGLFFFGPRVEASEITGPIDFKACTELALRQSPYLTQSALEIDVRRLDESDSRWSFVPYLYVKSRYALNWASENDSNLRNWSISFATGSYDPLKSYFSLKARELITEVAILGHLNVIFNGIYDLAQKFLELEALHKAAAYGDKFVATAHEKLAFVEKRHNMGSASLLDVQVAAQQMAVARAERERLTDAHRLVLQEMRFFLGIKAGDKLDVDFEDARRQVLGGFDIKSAKLEQARANSIELKIQEVRKALQEWNITLAYAKYIPTLSFSVSTPDIAQSNLDGRDYYASINASMPLWEGMNRYRNIVRQKKIMKQIEADKEMKEGNLSIKWRTARSKLLNAEIDLKLAGSSEKLARLKEKQSKIRFNSNGRLLSTLLDSRMALIQEQKKVLSKTQNYVEALLAVRHLSGDLFNSHVKVASWKE